MSQWRTKNVLNKEIFKTWDTQEVEKEVLAARKRNKGQLPRENKMKTRHRTTYRDMEAEDCKTRLHPPTHAITNSPSAQN